MKKLTELLSFVTSDNRMKTDILQKFLRTESDKKLSQLMTGIQTHRFSTDEEALKSVYGNTDRTGKYRMLKTRLKNRLLDLVFVTDPNLSLNNAYERTLIQVSRNILAAHFFMLKDKRGIAISLLKPSLQTALQYEHTQAAITACRMLCYHEAYLGNEKEMLHYRKIFQNQQRLLSNEFKIESLYNEVLARITLTAGYDEETLRLIKKNFNKAQKIFGQQPCYLVQLYYYRLAMRYYHSRDQFQKVIESCRKFAGYLLVKPHLVQQVRLGEFAIYEMESCMRMRQFKEGIRCAERCIEHFPHFGTLWMQFNEYYFLLAMRTGNIHKALEIFNSVTGSKKFYKLPGIQKERWRLHEAFLNFALPDELPKRQFNLFKFLNQVPLANHDKPGYNLTILIAQILLLLNIRDHSRLIDCEIAFRDYVRRHIKKNKHHRHYYFGKMIMMLLKNDFTTKGIEEKAAECLKYMNQPRQSIEETEIIPYETLWQMLKEKSQTIPVEKS